MTLTDTLTHPFRPCAPTKPIDGLAQPHNHPHATLTPLTDHPPHVPGAPFRGPGVTGSSPTPSSLTRSRPLGPRCPNNHLEAGAPLDDRQRRCHPLPEAGTGGADLRRRPGGEVPVLYATTTDEVHDAR